MHEPSSIQTSILYRIHNQLVAFCCPAMIIICTKIRSNIEKPDYQNLSAREAREIPRNKVRRHLENDSKQSQIRHILPTLPYPYPELHTVLYFLISIILGRVENKYRRDWSPTKWNCQNRRYTFLYTKVFWPRI